LHLIRPTIRPIKTFLTGINTVESAAVVLPYYTGSCQSTNATGTAHIGTVVGSKPDELTSIRQAARAAQPNEQSLLFCFGFGHNTTYHNRTEYSRPLQSVHYIRPKQSCRRLRKNLQSVHYIRPKQSCRRLRKNLYSLTLVIAQVKKYDPRSQE
jgi:hypothetical protein